MYIIGTSMMRDWFENPRKTTRETIEQGLISSGMDIKTDIDEHFAFSDFTEPFPRKPRCIFEPICCCLLALAVGILVY